MVDISSRATTLSINGNATPYTEAVQFPLRLGWSEIQFEGVIAWEGEISLKQSANGNHPSLDPITNGDFIAGNRVQLSIADENGVPIDLNFRILRKPKRPRREDGIVLLRIGCLFSLLARATSEEDPTAIDPLIGSTEFDVLTSIYTQAGVPVASLPAAGPTFTRFFPVENLSQQSLITLAAQLLFNSGEGPHFAWVEPIKEQIEIYDYNTVATGAAIASISDADFIEIDPLDPSDQLDLLETIRVSGEAQDITPITYPLVEVIREAFNTPAELYPILAAQGRFTVDVNAPVLRNRTTRTTNLIGDVETVTLDVEGVPGGNETFGTQILRDLDGLVTPIQQEITTITRTFDATLLFLFTRIESIAVPQSFLFVGPATPIGNPLGDPIDVNSPRYERTTNLTYSTAQQRETQVDEERIQFVLAMMSIAVSPEIALPGVSPLLGGGQSTLFLSNEVTQSWTPEPNTNPQTFTYTVTVRRPGGFVNPSQDLLSLQVVPSESFTLTGQPAPEAPETKPTGFRRSVTQVSADTSCPDPAGPSPFARTLLATAAYPTSQSQIQTLADWLCSFERTKNQGEYVLLQLKREYLSRPFFRLDLTTSLRGGNLLQMLPQGGELIVEQRQALISFDAPVLAQVVPGLLDLSPGAAHAWSLDRAQASQGSPIEIRRVSDGMTTNIGLDGDNLDSAAINTFCAGTDCTIPQWFAITGSNLFRTSASFQPFIYRDSAGGLQTSGGSAEVSFPDRTGRRYFDVTGDNFPPATTSLALIAVVTPDLTGANNTSTGQIIMGSGGFFTGDWHFGIRSSGQVVIESTPGNVPAGSVISTTTVTDGQPVAVAALYDPAGATLQDRWSIFINQAQSATTAGGPLNQNTSNDFIASGPDQSASGFPFFWQGGIKLMAIYLRDFSSEILGAMGALVDTYKL